MNIRVLLVINSLDHGGSEHYIVRLTQTIPPNKFQFWVFYGQGNGSPLRRMLPETVRQVCVPRLHNWHIRAWKHAFAIAQLVKNNGIHLVHVFGTSSALLAWAGARMGGVPVIFTPGGPLQTRHPFEILSARTGLSRLVLPGKVDMWVAVSDFIKEELIRDVGIPSRKVSVIPHGVNLDQFRPLPPCSTARRGLELSATDQVLCTIGSLRPVKGIYKAIHFMAELRNLLPSAKLLIVGTGPLQSNYEELVSQLELNGHVRFLGTRTDIPEVLAVSDIYLVTVDAPLLGTATLEALACGKPIVTFTRDPVERRMATETVLEGKNGLIVSNDPRESAPRVAEILVNVECLRQMGAESRLLAERQFDFRRAAHLHEELYSQLVHQEVGNYRQEMHY